MYLFPGRSMPRPYDGNGSTACQCDGSYITVFVWGKATDSDSNHHTHTRTNLRGENDGVFLEEESEVTGEVETTGEPPSGRNIELSAAFIGERLEIEDSILKRERVQRFTISYRTKLQNWDTVWSRARSPTKIAYVPGAVASNQTAQCQQQN